MLSSHGIDASRKGQSVLKHVGGDKRAAIDTVHTSTTNDTVIIDVVKAGNVFCLLAATTDREVVVLAEACAQHLVLPIGIGPRVLNKFSGSAEVGSRRHVESIKHTVQGHITVVRHIGTALGTTLCGNYDNTVGSL